MNSLWNFQSFGQTVKGQKYKRMEQAGQKRGFFEFWGKSNRCDTTKGSNVVVPKKYILDKINVEY